MNIIAVLAGILVFIASWTAGIPLVQWIFGDTIGLVAVILATVSLVLLWRWINHKNTALLRMLVAFQVTMILVAISYAHFPDFIILQGGVNLSLLENQAPEKTIQALGWALLIGSVFILPALFYLYYSFQNKEKGHK